MWVSSPATGNLCSATIVADWETPTAQQPVSRYGVVEFSCAKTSGFGFALGSFIGFGKEVTGRTTALDPKISRQGRGYFPLGGSWVLWHSQPTLRVAALDSVAKRLVDYETDS